MKRFAFIPLLLSILLGCSQEEKAAKLINAFMTKIKFNADYTPTIISVPDEISCKKDTYPLYGGTWDDGAGGTDPINGAYLVNLSVNFLLSDPDAKMAEERLVCKLKARWTFDHTILQYQGGGQLESCDANDYDCTIGDMKLDCEKFKNVLAKFSCN